MCIRDRTITLTANLPSITDAVHIDGPGAANLTIDGADTYRVFSFYRIDASAGSDEVGELTITHGYSGNYYTGNPDNSGGAIQKFYGDADLLIENVVLTHNHSANDGGAINLYTTTGHVTLNHVTMTHNSAVEGGGALYADGGSGPDSGLVVTIVDSTITDNEALYGGGALYIEDGTFSIVRTEIARNSSGYAGGGIFADEATVSIDHSVVADNTTTSDSGGGGAFLYDTTTTITSSTISGNVATAGGGGGIKTVEYYYAASLLLTNSTVSGNRAFYYGGGLYLRGSGGTAIVQSTISGNTARQAGGIYVGDTAGAAMLLSTVTDNTAGVLPDGTAGAPGTLPAVHGIQVGGGTRTDSVGPAARRHGPVRARGAERDHDGKTHEPAPGGAHGLEEAPPAPGTLQLIGVIAAGNGNLDVGDYRDEAVSVESLASVLGTVENHPWVTVTDFGGTQRDATAAALALGPLADNGGPTKTHALLPGSVAIDAGPDPSVLPTFPGGEYDQRGEPYARVSGGKVDVGAYEVQVPPEPTFTG